MSLTDERKKIEKNKNDLKAARTAINNKLVELGGVASTSFNDVPEKTTELANTITATNKEYIDNKTGNLNNLQTQDKTNLVNAINEIKSSSEKSQFIEKTILASEWQGNKYSLESDYPFSQYDLFIIDFADTVTKEQIYAWGDGMIRGSMTENVLTALDIVPKIDVPVKLELVKKGA